jgi:uncharacterized membrane protein YeiB
MLRHLLFNGIYPVFPWVAFLFLGMWLARNDLSDDKARKSLFFAGLGAFLIAECVSWAAFNKSPYTVPGIDLENSLLWLAIDPWEPMPLFVLSAGGTALAVIVACDFVSEKCRRSRWTFPVASVGQSTLTLYMAHIVAGDLALRCVPSTVLKAYFPFWGSIVFCLIAVPFCVLWNRRFHKGPLELLAHLFIRAFPKTPPLLGHGLKGVIHQ